MKFLCMSDGRLYGKNAEGQVRAEERGRRAFWRKNFSPRKQAVPDYPVMIMHAVCQPYSSESVFKDIMP